MKDDWIKFKRYPHIGFPFSGKDIPFVKNYVTDPEKVAKHKFTPFLHKTIESRKFRPVDGLLGPDEPRTKNKYKKRVREFKGTKSRPIFYASHLDSLVYGYYSDCLLEKYEAYIKDKSFSTSAVAYRKISVNPEEPHSKPRKSNIEFAKEAFDFIEANKSQELSIIVADITSFFDNLDHRILHREWKKVLGLDNLPEDHYAVYKSLLKLAYVNENEIFNRFKSRLWVERGEPHKPDVIVRKKKAVKKRKHLRNERVVAYCEKSEFFRKHHDLIRVVKTGKGIPQGTAISATLANIYMLEFDKEVYTEISNKKGFYQRYSDDMIIVCKQEDEQAVLNLITKEIEKVKLEVQPAKTKTYRYSSSEGKFRGGLIKDNVVYHNYQLEYLGFRYDGERVLIKTSGFSKFYRGMKRSITRGAYYASRSTNPDRTLYKTRLYKRFTTRGAKRRLIWKPDPHNPGKFIKTNQQDWGNYFSYINKADNAFYNINGKPVIKRQGRKIWNKFHQEIKEAEQVIKSNRSKLS